METWDTGEDWGLSGKIWNDRGQLGTIDDVLGTIEKDEQRRVTIRKDNGQGQSGTIGDDWERPGKIRDDRRSLETIEQRGFGTTRCECGQSGTFGDGQRQFETIGDKLGLFGDSFYQ